MPMSLLIGNLTMNRVHKTDFINWNFELLWTSFLFELYRTSYELEKICFELHNYVLNSKLHEQRLTARAQLQDTNSFLSVS